MLDMFLGLAVAVRDWCSEIALLKKGSESSHVEEHNLNLAQKQHHASLLVVGGCEWRDPYKGRPLNFGEVGLFPNRWEASSVSFLP